MSGEQRRRLATAAANGGYPGALLPAIAQATLPKYATGQQLTERQLGEIADAVELLAEARLDASQVDALIAGCRKRAPRRWREVLWALVVKAACPCARPSQGS
jgi:hypothetical protein